MTRQQAMKQDKDFYADMDGDDWYVFGDNSGFAYSQHSNLYQANTRVDQMRAALIVD